MLARLQQALTLGLLALATLWLTAFWRVDHPLLALSGAALLMSVHAWVLAAEFVLLWFTHGSEAAPRASARALFRAWRGEVLAAWRVFGWRQPFCSRRWPDNFPPTEVGRQGVVLVHGFFCNRGIWNDWLHRLIAAGVPAVAVNLEPVFGPIDELAPMLETAVSQLEQRTGCKPIVVAHSMGGLVVRDWSRRHNGGERLQHAITIASPHRGTWLARFGHGPSARQMRQRSAWLQGLAKEEGSVPAKQFICFYSDCDNIVFPPSTATLPDADNRRLAGVAHVHMVDRDEPWQALLNCLAAEAVPAFRA